MTEEKLNSCLEDLMKATIQAYRLMVHAEDPDVTPSTKAITWMASPNDYLFGSSPMELCLRGDGGLLIEWIKERLGEEQPSY